MKPEEFTEVASLLARVVKTSQDAEALYALLDTMGFRRKPLTDQQARCLSLLLISLRGCGIHTSEKVATNLVCNKRLYRKYLVEFTDAVTKISEETKVRYPLVAAFLIQMVITCIQDRINSGVSKMGINFRTTLAALSSSNSVLVEKFPAYVCGEIGPQLLASAILNETRQE
jgi:hypothetical protein